MNLLFSLHLKTLIYDKYEIKSNKQGKITKLWLSCN
jgi:hypothetical protein